MGIRLPNPRYIGDGLYVRHDGQQFWIESSNGITVSQRVAMDGNTLSQLNDYAEYMTEFYNNNQHQVEPGCDDCGADLTNYESPIVDTVKGDIYRVRHLERYVEIRLCRNCAQIIDEPYLNQLLAKRATQSAHSDR